MNRLPQSESDEAFPTTFIHGHTQIESDDRLGDGSPLAADPRHLVKLHSVVEHLLFRADGTPPYCDIARPSQEIRKHLIGFGDGPQRFNQAYPQILGTLLYGKALYTALARPLESGIVESEFANVPNALRETLLDRPIVVADWGTMTLFRKQLRAKWLEVRKQLVKPAVAFLFEGFKPKDTDDFVGRASHFIQEDFERHARPGADFYELAERAITAYTRWQEILIVQTKMLTTPESLNSHNN